ncbi:MAG: hypothetical protein Tsb002_36230 [Wenzhouxiangellaceae bacterium]
MSNAFQRGAWYDRWLASDAEEELEANGLQGQGRAIIAEFNQLYERTGTLRRMVGILLPAIREAYAANPRPVRLLELSARDGTLMHMVREAAAADAIPVDLHAVEFRQDTAEFAREQCEQRGDPVTIHLDSSQVLDGFQLPGVDIVYSTFLLHHRTPRQCLDICNTSQRLARHGVYHFDPIRSLLGVSLSWTFYTFAGFSVSKRDSILSVRRSFRPYELRRLLEQAVAEWQVDRQGPLYQVARWPSD